MLPVPLLAYVKSEIVDGIELECTNKGVVSLKFKSSFFGWENGKMVASHAYLSPSDRHIYITQIQVLTTTSLSYQNKSLNTGIVKTFYL